MAPAIVVEPYRFAMLLDTGDASSPRGLLGHA
jgi:hypothetical protein